MKALSKELQKKAYLSSSLWKSDVVLVNSHHWRKKLWQLLIWRLLRPGGVLLHRIDGPISLIRGTPASRFVDRRIALFSRLVADGAIFQSLWSQSQSAKLGITNHRSVVILNAPDGDVFYKKSQNKIPESKFKVIAAAWSSNSAKGFHYFSALDRSIDSASVEVVFVGNSPIPFERILHKPPMASRDLATELRAADVFLAASENDPCSNALIEAIHCGLVPIALDSGGHPELVRNNRLMFSNLDELENILKLGPKELRRIWGSGHLPKLEEVAENYVDFARSLMTPSSRVGPAIKIALFWLADAPLQFSSRFSGWVGSRAFRQR